MSCQQNLRKPYACTCYCKSTHHTFSVESLCVLAHLCACHVTYVHLSCHICVLVCALSLLCNIMASIQVDTSVNEGY